MKEMKIPKTNKKSEAFDMTGKPIPKTYIRIGQRVGGDSVLQLLEEFDIHSLYDENHPEEFYVISFVEMTDEEYNSLDEFQGF